MNAIIETLLKEISSTDDPLRMRNRFRPATVAASSTDTNSIPVTIDGDPSTSTSYAISLIGPLAKGQRVMVVFVPPAGAYIIGGIGGATPIVQEQSFYLKPDAPASITAGSWVDWPPVAGGGPLLMNFVKQQTMTELSIDMSMTFYLSTTLSGVGIDFGVEINASGTPVMVIDAFTNVTGDHRCFTRLGCRIPDVPSGSVQLSLQARAGGTVFVDSNDYCSVVVREVYPLPAA